jgi:hypothetical protein
MPVEPFDSRWVTDPGGGTGKQVYVLENTGDPSGCKWHAMGPKALFLDIDLRASGTVKTKEDPNIAYDRLPPDPGDAEKVAIMEALEDWKLSGRQIQFGTGDSAPGTRTRSSQPLSTAQPRGWEPRNQRHPWRRRQARIVRNIREAGPSQVMGGVCVSGGLIMKVWLNVSVWVTQLRTLFFTERNEKTKLYLQLENLTGNLEKHVDRVRFCLEYLYSFASYCGDSWDTVLLVLFAMYFLWKWFWGPSEVSHQVQEQRREDSDRASRLERLLERQHREVMQARPRVGEPAMDGDLGALEGRLKAYEDGIRRDSGRAARPSTEAPGSTPDSGWVEKIQTKMNRLLRRAQNPLDRVRILIQNMRPVDPWNFPNDFQARLSADWAMSLYGSGTLGKVHAQRYADDHGLQNCKSFNAYHALCEISDAFVMDDQWPELFNSHGYERLARWGYALQQVHQDCKVESDWKDERGGKRKTRWDLMSRYHVTEARLVDAHSQEAEDEVSTALQRSALLQKWLKKSADGG